jgi:hypothetical protein
MTLTHIDFGIVQRSKTRFGKPGCAVKTSAYLMCGALSRDDGTQYDFSRKRGELVHTEIMLPDGAPDRFRYPKILWNACEFIERRSDSQTARQVLLTIPRECPAYLRVDLARQVAERWRQQGMAVQYAVHCPPSSADHDEQPHIHFQMTMRAIENTATGLSPRKRMDWNTQFFGPSRGRDERARICDDANTFFAQRDLQIRLDPRTLEQQGIDRPPEPDAARPVWEAWKRQGADPDRAPPPVAAVLRHRELRALLRKHADYQGRIAVQIAADTRAISIADGRSLLRADAARSMRPAIDRNQSQRARAARTPQQIRGEAIEAARAEVNRVGRDRERKAMAEEATRAAVQGDTATIAAFDAGRADEAMKAAAERRTKLDEEALAVKRAREQREALERRNAPQVTFAQP